MLRFQPTSVSSNPFTLLAALPDDFLGFAFDHDDLLAVYGGEGIRWLAKHWLMASKPFHENVGKNATPRSKICNKCSI